MPDWTVLITDHTWPSIDIEREVLSKVGARIVDAPSPDEEELIPLVRTADAILTCFALVSARVISHGERLQVIGRYGIGVDNIAVHEATKHHIMVTNVPVYCVDEVATHALALILDLARGITGYDRAVRSNDWSLSSQSPIFRVAGRTLGIIGLGQIGKMVATRAAALGFRVIAHDPGVGSVPADYEIELTSLADLADRADVVSLHAPLTPTTEHLIDAAFFRRLKPTAVIVNTARGGLIDQAALIAALTEGRIAGAALDVVVPERIPPEHPLLNHPKCIITPHVAFYSEESVQDLQRRAAGNVADVLDGRRPSSVVNPEVLSDARWNRLSKGS